MSSKSRVRRGALVVVGVVAIALVAVWIALAFVVDVEAVRAQHDERLLSTLSSGAIDLRAQQKAMRHFHAGAPPCDVYDDSSLSDDDIDAVGAALVGAGIGGKLADVGMLVLTWGREAESKRHGPVSDAEMLASWDLTASSYDKVIALVARDRLITALRNQALKLENDLSAKARAEEAALLPSERMALRAIWEQHPAALSMPGFLKTFSRLRGWLPKGEPSVTTVRCLDAVNGDSAEKVFLTLEKGASPAKDTQVRCAEGSPLRLDKTCTIVRSVDDGVFEATCQ